MDCRCHHPVMCLVGEEAAAKYSGRNRHRPQMQGKWQGEPGSSRSDKALVYDDGGARFGLRKTTMPPLIGVAEPALGPGTTLYIPFMQRQRCLKRTTASRKRLGYDGSKTMHSGKG
jgi:hypothetical protein